MRENHYTCIISGVEKYIPPSLAKNKITKFGSKEELRKHYVCPAMAKLLRRGDSVQDIRESLNITGLPNVNPIILARLKLIRNKKGLRTKESAEKLERQRYLNSKEYKDKIRDWEERQRNMTFRDWVEKYTGTGRERGGTCVRPDIFLSHNNRACDGCIYYEFCMCYSKRMSHEKRKSKKR